MSKVLKSFAQGWWEMTPSKLSEEEARTLRGEGDPDARSAILRNFEERSRRPASPEDSQTAESLLRKHHEGEYSSASVVLPSGRGHVCPKGGGWIRF